MRDHLHGGAKIIAAPFLGDHIGINPTGGHIVALPRRHAGETLVMAKIEIGFRAVVGDIHLAVLIGTHSPGVDIQIRVKFPQTHTVPAGLQENAKRCRRQPLAK